MDLFDLRCWHRFVEVGGQPDTVANIDQVVVDSRMITSSNSLFVAFSGKSVSAHAFIPQTRAKFVLVDSSYNGPDNGQSLLRVDDPVRALQEIAAAYRRQLSTKIVAITGSFGKTVLKDLLVDFLRTEHTVAFSPESFNSQIGVPLSLFTIGKKDDLAVIEVGISQVGEMEPLVRMLGADYAILTNIGKAHLSTMKELKLIAKEKASLLLSVGADGWVLHPQDRQLLPFLAQLKARSFSWEKPLASELSYASNIVEIATQAASLLGVSKDRLREQLKGYSPEPMCRELWQSSSGFTVINDSYCSHPLSVLHSLKYLRTFSGARKKVFVFSGLRDYSESSTDFQQIGKAIAQAGVNELFLVGKKNYAPLVSALKESSPLIQVESCNEEEEVARKIKKGLKKGDTVLLKGAKKTPLEPLYSAFSEEVSNSRLLINVSAIGENIEAIREKLPENTRIMAIVKGSGYGTDGPILAKSLLEFGIDIFGVANVDEAIALRNSGIIADILVINAAPFEVEKIVYFDLQVGVSSQEMVTALAQCKKKQPVKVHLHIDTGMSRFGCRVEDSLKLAEAIIEADGLDLEGVMTHFACAEDAAEDAFTLSQKSRFESAIKRMREKGVNPVYTHISNSAGAIRFSGTNMVRLGIAMFGISQSSSVEQEFHFSPALKLTSRIVGINRCKRGETISYGRNYVVEREEEKIAVIPLGYFDGIHRHYSGKGEVSICGKLAPMVGSICMDFMMCDITHIAEAKVGDVVTVFGGLLPSLSIEEFAFRGDSISHELIACLGPRIQRIFVYE